MSLTSLSALASVSGFVKGNPSIDYYKVLGFSPELVADFDDEYYRANSSPTTFDGLLTHSRLSNATMVDSDGLIKWGPHNLLTYSEDFSNAAWGKNNATVSGVGTALVIPAAGTRALNADGVSQNTTFTAGWYYTIEATFKSNGLRYAAIGMSNGAGFTATAIFDLETVVVSGTGAHPSAADNLSASIFPLGVGEFRCSFRFRFLSALTILHLTGSTAGSSGVYGRDITGDGTNGVYVSKPTIYRSDLGGMVNNPDTGNSYVPTTSSARYLPRRGHHVWNGSAWVNEGLLIETEARTNLALYSRDLSDAAWTKTDVTAAKTATAVTGETNGATTLTATAGNGTVTQAITSASALRVTSMWVKRRTGTGDIEMTQDGGSTWTAVTVTSGWTRVNLDAITSTDPTVGIRIVTSGDEIDVDFFQHEVGGQLSSEIPTSGATVTRAADTLTIPSANLPWPTPKVIGPELVTNGTFDDATGWTLGPGWTISGGVASLVGSAGSTDRLELTGGFDGGALGTVYQINFDVSGLSGTGTLAFSRMSGTTSFTTNGAKSVIAVTTVAGPGGFSFFTAAGGAMTIDNISVREIDPLAVSIQMDGRMTYADTGNSELIFFNWMADNGNYIQANLRTQTTATGEVYQIQAAAGVADDVDGRSSQYSPGINVPFNIASRHGSTFINGAVDGTALSADNTPVALPDLSSTDLSLAYDYMGCIRQFRVWAADLGDSGIAEASEGEPSSYLIWDASADTYIQKVYD